MTPQNEAADIPAGRRLELTHRGLVELSPTGDGDCWRLRRLRHRGGMRDEQIINLSADEIHAMRVMLATAASRDGRAP